ncbi:hypothetical protein QAD02_007910 [Eretmocerus hayati]|uniref:Uncharacterized protein n=1 Tax=Eretmocerus hayati TaxID=131215 RepID=A0ACC2N4Z4_9HYME|nr:hypothetical protein QAD02_007910 [Eretmocerus hayati]
MILENVHSNGTAEMSDEIINEVKEQMVKEKNVIFLGIPENNSSNFFANFLLEILTDAPFDVSQLRSQRLGKLVADSCRPVKLICEYSEDAKWILVIQKGFSPDGVECVNDRTWAQRQLLLRRQNELEVRKKGGQHNLTIRFIK